MILVSWKRHKLLLYFVRYKNLSWIYMQETNQITTFRHGWDTMYKRTTSLKLTCQWPPVEPSQWCLRQFFHTCSQDLHKNLPRHPTFWSFGRKLAHWKTSLMIGNKVSLFQLTRKNFSKVNYIGGKIHYIFSSNMQHSPQNTQLLTDGHLFSTFPTCFLEW